MSQVRKYQEGGVTPIKKDNEIQVAEQITPVVPGLEEITLKQKTVPTTEQSKQKPTSYIILDGEKFENNEENLGQKGEVLKRLYNLLSNENKIRLFYLRTIGFFFALCV